MDIIKNYYNLWRYKISTVFNYLDIINLITRKIEVFEKLKILYEYY